MKSAQRIRKELQSYLHETSSFDKVHDDAGTLRHVWLRETTSEKDCLLFVSKRHFDLRENILKEIKQRQNSGFCVVAGARNNRWYAFRTSVQPLVSNVLSVREEIRNYPDGARPGKRINYFRLKYCISGNLELRLNDYPDIAFYRIEGLSL